MKREIQAFPHSNNTTATRHLPITWHGEAGEKRLRKSGKEITKFFRALTRDSPTVRYPFRRGVKRESGKR